MFLFLLFFLLRLRVRFEDLTSLCPDMAAEAEAEDAAAVAAAEGAEPLALLSLLSELEWGELGWTVVVSVVIRVAVAPPPPNSRGATSSADVRIDTASLSRPRSS